MTEKALEFLRGGGDIRLWFDKDSRSYCIRTAKVSKNKYSPSNQEVLLAKEWRVTTRAQEQALIFDLVDNAINRCINEVTAKYKELNNA